MTAPKAVGTAARRVWALAATAAIAIAVGAAVVAAPDAPRSKGAPSGEALAVAYDGWDGGRATTAQFAGKPLVVNFWASWCASCIAEIPAFARVYERHRGEVAFLGLNVQDDPGSAERMRRELSIPYELGRDRGGHAFRAFGSVAMPTTVLIDSSGAVVQRLDGGISERELEGRLEALLEAEA